MYDSAILFKQWKLEPDKEEFTIMRIKISGKEKLPSGQAAEKDRTVIYNLLDEYDHQTKTSSWHGQQVTPAMPA